MPNEKPAATDSVQITLRGPDGQVKQQENPK